VGRSLTGATQAQVDACAKAQAASSCGSVFMVDIVAGLAAIIPPGARISSAAREQAIALVISRMQHGNYDAHLTDAEYDEVEAALQLVRDDDHVR
jgi:hypothetical protein